MADWPVRLQPSVDAALRDLGSDDVESRVSAISAIAAGDPDALGREARTALAAALGDSSPKVRAAAALALAELGAGSAGEERTGTLDRLVELAGDPDGTVAQAAVIALGESGEPRVLATVERALGSRDADVRFQAVLAVARLGGVGAIATLAGAADDPDPEVRANVAAALADLGHESGAPTLERLLADADEAVRVEAALALAQRGDRRSTPVLVAALGNAEAAPQAVRALALLRDPAAVEPLRKLGARWTARAPLRAAAAAALAALDDPAGWRELDGWLRSRRREPRAMAVHAAGELALSGAVDRLVEMLRDPSLPDRDGVARSLGAIGDPRARDALAAATDDPDPDVALEARRALDSLERRA